MGDEKKSRGSAFKLFLLTNAFFAVVFFVLSVKLMKRREK